MFLRKDKTPRAPSPYPRWLSWVFVIFLGYILYVGNFGTAPRPPKPDAAPEQQTTAEPPKEYPALRALTDKDRWQRAIDPAYVGSTSWRDDKPGEGEEAVCGGEVTIKLRGTLENGANFDPAHKEDVPMHFRLGQAPYKALDNALLGLKPGGTRQITAPPQLVYKEGVNRTRESVVLYVERTDSPVASAPDRLPLKVIEDEIGSGEGAACGQKISISLTAWSDKGVVAFKSATPLRVTPGEGQLLASGLDAALVGIKEGGQRTIVLPPVGDTPTDQLMPTDAVWKQWHDLLSSHRVVIVTVTRLASSATAVPPARAE